ncbi:protein kinase, AMP-activated, alpha 2 catalytic subunit, partial [Kappamyces sp. JEL0680]
MSEGEARKLFQQIISAVEHCHFHKIVHRDLKPENILLDALKNVKIADFGLSNYLEDGDFLKTSCGSPNYAAPEVISGKLYAGPEIDVWSCGVILYVMLCGQLPFDDDHIPTLFKKINSGIFRLPSFLSSASKDLLSAMLTVDPLKRITIPEIRKAPWFAKDLPAYLLPTYHLIEKSPYAEMNEPIVEELSKKMKFCLQTIYHALSEPENNQIQVAYRLMVDNLPIERQVKGSDPIIASLKDMHISLRESEKSSIQIISNSIPPSKEETVEPRKMRTTRSRWHYGIRSRSDPFEIMLEIYNALSRTSLKWKSMDNYKIRCYDVSPRGDEVKFEIQLYKIEPGNYLVDFKRISPRDRLVQDISHSSSVYTFFEACIKL